MAKNLPFTVRGRTGKFMEKAIEAFVSYLHDVKNVSGNTELSYRRDLEKFGRYMEEKGLTDIAQVRKEDIGDFLKALEAQNLKAATISRNIASIKAFYLYLEQEKLVEENCAQELRAPRVEKRLPGIITAEEAARLVEQPAGKSPKEIRDRAMLELLCATGIRVTELVTLKLADLDMQRRCILCRDSSKARRIPFGEGAERALKRYLEEGRPALLSYEPREELFLNCSGRPMSRQGFWKLLKTYAKQAGIGSEITPHTLRHTLAAHLMKSGANPRSIQEIMGYADVRQAYIPAKRL